MYRLRVSIELSIKYKVNLKFPQFFIRGTFRDLNEFLHFLLQFFLRRFYKIVTTIFLLTFILFFFFLNARHHIGYHKIPFPERKKCLCFHQNIFVFNMKKFPQTKCDFVRKNNFLLEWIYLFK